MNRARLDTGIEFEDEYEEVKNKLIMGVNDNVN